MTKAPKTAAGAPASQASQGRGHKVPEASARAILQASLAASGFVPTQIAAQLGLSPAEVARIEAEFAELRAAARKAAQAPAEAAPPAADETNSKTQEG